VTYVRFRFEVFGWSGWQGLCRLGFRGRWCGYLVLGSVHSGEASSLDFGDEGCECAAGANDRSACLWARFGLARGLCGALRRKCLCGKPVRGLGGLTRHQITFLRGWGRLAGLEVARLGGGPVRSLGRGPADRPLFFGLIVEFLLFGPGDVCYSVDSRDDCEDQKLDPSAVVALEEQL